MVLTKLNTMKHKTPSDWLGGMEVRAQYISSIPVVVEESFCAVVLWPF